MSIESGIPTFRGKNGLWKNQLQFGEQSYDYEDLMCHQAYLEQFEKAWELALLLKKLYVKNEPHLGYSKLLREIAKKNYFVVTSNCDEYFRKAGYDEERIVEIHGSLFDHQCLNNCTDEIWHTSNINTIPLCPACGGRSRPNIKMFGDWHWNSSKAKDQEKRYLKWIKSVKQNHEKILIIEIGAGKRLASIREISERVAGKDNTLIRINTLDHQVSRPNHVSIAKKAIDGINDLCS